MNLAPKHLYYLRIISLVLGLVFVGFLMTQFAKWRPETELTTLVLLFTVELALLVFLMVKCRYLIQDPNDSKTYIYGHVLGHGRLSAERMVIKKIWGRRLYLVGSGRVEFYILSDERKVEEFISKN